MINSAIVAGVAVSTIIYATSVATAAPANTTSGRVGTTVSDQRAPSTSHEPQIDLARQHVCGFEALVRWHHAEVEMIPPDRFIPIAEENGLIVPVVKSAETMNVVGLARAVRDVAERARGKRLTPDDVQGGTFTITNPGIFGTTIGFPIVNQPQVAIMGVGAVEKRPVVITDEFGNDAIVARKRGFISLGYDHRLVNGADGDQFLARIKQLMENFPEEA